MDRIYRIILILFIFLLTPFCSPDGMFKGQGAIVPGIPYQAGIIRYKDGEETLIIQSYMEAEQGDNFGWIIPLPENPKEIKQFPSGLFKTLPYCFGPHVFQFSEGMLFLLVVCIILVFISMRYSSSLLKLAFNIIVIFIVFLFLSAILVPNYLDTGSEVSPVIQQSSVKVLQYGKEGVYQFHILKAKDPQSLNEWLKNNNLQFLSGNELKIVEDYIKDDWVFGVLHFTRENRKEIVSPNPVSFVFSTTKPVYPMKLTGMASKLPEIYLYVVADNKYSAEGYKAIFSSEISLHESWKNSWESRYYRSRIYHPAADFLFWEGCWITVLRARMSPELAANDTYLNIEGRRPQILQLMTKRTALIYSLCSALLFISPFLFFFHLIWRSFKGNMKIPRKIYLVSIVLTILLSAYVYRDLLTFEQFNMKIDKNAFKNPNLYQVLSTFKEDLKNKNLSMESLSDEEIKKLIMENENEMIRTNQITGEPITCEDSPGNFTIERKDTGERIIYFYDIMGMTNELNI